jgi:hypothetical protein
VYKLNLTRRNMHDKKKFDKGTLLKRRFYFALSSLAGT